MKAVFPNNWMQSIVPYLDSRYDFTILGSMSQIGSVEKNQDWERTILYNWDHYAFVNYQRSDWVKFHYYCTKAKEVWVPTHAHASYYRAFSGIDSYVINLACVQPEEWEKETHDDGYILMSSRQDWYKRFPMFERACQDLGIAYKTTHPEHTSREEYTKLMSGCRGYVQASIDESLGGLSLMEAVWNNKPVLMSDSMLGGKEVYGDTINYFSSYDFADFKKQLLLLSQGSFSQPNARKKIENQTPSGVAEAINLRLCQLACT